MSRSDTGAYAPTTDKSDGLPLPTDLEVTREWVANELGARNGAKAYVPMHFDTVGDVVAALEADAPITDYGGIGEITARRLWAWYDCVWGGDAEPSYSTPTAEQLPARLRAMGSEGER
jgi:hypothetical protein